jgi:hypothetical protein
MANSSPPAWGFGSSIRDEKIQRNKDTANVAPGSYEVNLSDKKKLPSYSMSLKLKTSSPTSAQSPAPGTYMPPSKILESPGKSFHKRLDNKHFQGDLGSGPGGYNAEKLKTGDFKFSMSKRLDDIGFRKRNFQPGAGTYDPERTVTQKDSPKWRFGTGERSEMGSSPEIKGKPGPGAYK